MSQLLYRLGRACAHHPLLVIALWVVVGIAIVLGAGRAGSQAADDLTLPGTDSTRASDLLDRKLPKEANGTVPIAVERVDGKLTTARNKRAVQAATRSLRGAPDVRSAASPYGDQAADALSKNKRIGYISLTLTVGPDELDEEEGQRIIAAAAPAKRAGLEVAAGGYLGQEVSKPDTELSERLGIVAAIVILLIALGTAVAMALPISTAVLGVVLGLSGITLLSNVVDVPTVAPTLGTMIGLGVGIDYALFIVTRHRSRLADGLEVHESVARACATSGSAVVFAGGTVVIALCSLALADIPIVSALGYSAALVVVIAVVSANTLLPALLALLERRIESLAVPVVERRRREGKSRGWTRWAGAVARRPWPAIVLAVVLLLALAYPLLGMRLGQQDYGVFPKEETIRQAYDTLSRGFGPGINGTYLIAVHFDRKAHNDQAKLNKLEAKQARQKKREQQKVSQQANEQAEELVAEGVPPDEAQQQATEEAEQAAPPESTRQKQQFRAEKQFLESPESDPRLVQLRNRIKRTPRVDSVSQAQVDKTDRAAVFSVTPKTAPTATATTDLVVDLRDSVIPDATQGEGIEAYVGGVTAGYIDLAERIGEKLPSVIAIVVGLSFVLLLVAFRSIMIPVTAALMNLLSVAAAYGVLTLVFENGFLISVIGLEHPVPIVSYVPLLMFAILFGLSMDYQVFLVSRVRDRWIAKPDNRDAVVGGLADSGRVITSAALIMVAVFSSFALNGDPTVKQFGVGMAVAIAMDATVVRCLLVPAVMVLLNRANWWLPGWLGRALPRFGLEAEDGLPAVGARKSDAAAAA